MGQHCADLLMLVLWASTAPIFADPTPVAVRTARPAIRYYPAPSPGGYKREPMQTMGARPPARKQTVPKRVTTSTLRTRASTQRGTVLVPYSYRAWGSSSGSFCGPGG